MTDILKYLDPARLDARVWQVWREQLEIDGTVRLGVPRCQHRAHDGHHGADLEGEGSRQCMEG